MLEERKVTRYYGICDKCGRNFGQRARKSLAEADIKMHEHVCGKHFQQHDNTGGYRGILGGWNVYCVCGAHWVTETPTETFKCPKDIPRAKGI